MEIISTKRGGKKLCLDGYMYTIKNIAKSKDEVSWRCVKRDCAMKCSAMLKTNKEYTGARLVKEHSHPADETGVSVEKCRHSMKSSASTANDKPNQILTFAAAAAPDEVQGKCNGVFLPLAYALLQRKTQTSYEVMLRVLEEAGCDPSVVIVDFERSVELALHAVFGEHVTIQYCFYHLTQSIWRKIQSLGLTNLYESDDDFRLFCGQIDALAFLPLHEVSEGMTYLRESAPEESTPLLEYFDTNYVTGHLRPRPQTPDLQLRFRRVPPIFAPAQWNMHEVTLANQPRTNNVSEGWNNKFRNLVGQSHPTVWKLIECLQAECARVSAVLLQDERGVRPKKRIKKVYTELQGRLHNLCEDRSLGRKSIPDFLRV